MQLQYEVSLEDLKAYNLFHGQHSPSIRRMQRIIRFGLPVLLTFFMARTFLDPFEPLLFAVWIVLMIGIIVFFPAVMRRAVGTQVEKMFKEGVNKGVLGPQRLKIDEQGILCESEVSETKLRWDAVERVEVDEEHAYLYCSAASALIVPRRAFEEDQAFETFVSEVRRYRAFVAT